MKRKAYYAFDKVQTYKNEGWIKSWLFLLLLKFIKFYKICYYNITESITFERNKIFYWSFWVFE